MVGMADEWLDVLFAAMDAVNADMRATGLPGTGRLVKPEWSEQNLFVETWDLHHGSTSGISPDGDDDLVSALVAVADDAQDAVMETIWAAWPVCPSHGFGAHARERDGSAVWWCGGGENGGHVAAGIGEWERLR